MSHDLDEVLAGARRRLARLEPLAAFAAQQAGALIVDIRPHAQRLLEGEVPGALVIERNVLEWRFDPRRRTLSKASTLARCRAADVARRDVGRGPYA